MDTGPEYVVPAGALATTGASRNLMIRDGRWLRVALVMATEMMGLSSRTPM